MSTTKRLDHISSISDSKEQTEKYQGLIEELMNRVANDGNADDLETVLSHLLGNGIAHAVCRAGIQCYAEAVKRLAGETLYNVALKAVTAIKNSANSYDEADSILREALFEYCVSQEMFSEAGAILSGLNLDSSQKPYSEGHKVDILIRCAEAFLEDGQGAEAEIFMNRASPHMHAVTDWSLQLRYSVTLARVLDSNRKFLDAAIRYFNLSNTKNKQVCQDDLLELYAKGITCAVLAKAGPQRERVIDILQKDERLDQIESVLPQYAAHGAMLWKMHNSEVVREDDLDAFDKCLLPHQKAVTADGFTLLQKACIEHNMIAARRLYHNIYISELAHLLRLDDATAEKVAASMISEGRLKASLDQIEGMLYFVDKGEEEDCRRQWVESIQDTCDELNSCVDRIQTNALAAMVAAAGGASK